MNGGLQQESVSTISFGKIITIYPCSCKAMAKPLKYCAATSSPLAAVAPFFCYHLHRESCLADQRIDETEQKLHQRVPASQTNADWQVKFASSCGPQDGCHDLQDLDGLGDVAEEAFGIADGRDAGDRWERRRSWEGNGGDGHR